MSSTRVMATCAVLGQAVGTAAAIAVNENTSPRGVYENDLTELQETLMEDDAYLPRKKKSGAEFVKNAKITSNKNPAEALVNGFDRVIGNDENAWHCQAGDWAEFYFGKEVKISKIRLVFDSDLNDTKRMPHIWPLGENLRRLPQCLVKSYTVSYRLNGTWADVINKNNNYHRNVSHKAMNSKVQNLLTNAIEPLYTSIFINGAKSKYPSDILRYMWKLLMQNHAHDSICGCSKEQAHKHMEDRFERIFEMCILQYKNVAKTNIKV